MVTTPAKDDKALPSTVSIQADVADALSRHQASLSRLVVEAFYAQREALNTQYDTPVERYYASLQTRRRANSPTTQRYVTLSRTILAQLNTESQRLSLSRSRYITELLRLHLIESA